MVCDLNELDTRILQILEWLPYSDEITKDRLLHELAELNSLADTIESNIIH